MPSSVSEAMFQINEFKSRDTSTPWQLDKSAVALRLEEIVNCPTKISQGNLNLCGPAAFFVLWCKHDPLAFTNYCINLYEYGKSSIGSINVNPDSDLLNQNYDNVHVRMTLNCPHTEWMAMSALRDSENAILDFEGTPEEDVSGITTPSEIKNWLDATGCYQSVQNEGAFVENPGVDHARKLNPNKNEDVVMLINANLIPGSTSPPFDIITSRFPNHYILLNSPVEFTDDTVSFTYWTWGVIRSRLEINIDCFDQNYFGAIVAYR